MNDDTTYWVYQCKHCGATILRSHHYNPPEWANTFFEFNTLITCCESPNTGWAPGIKEIPLPDDEIPEPEFPKRSRVELVLEDYKTPLQDTTRS